MKQSLISAEPPADLPLPEPAPVCVDEAWRRARLDYERGVSAPVCAERHGLGERQVRRRARAEGWRRPAGPGTGAGSYREVMLGSPPPLWAGEPEPLGGQDLEETNPELAMVLEARSFEVGELLMNPEPERLNRFAFRRAAEAASRGAVTEAGAWMRLSAQVSRATERLERSLRPGDPADVLRARYLSELRELAAHMADDADAPEDP